MLGKHNLSPKKLSPVALCSHVEGSAMSRSSSTCKWTCWVAMAGNAIIQVFLEDFQVETGFFPSWFQMHAKCSRAHPAVADHPCSVWFANQAEV